jgi:hypothetical protein
MARDLVTRSARRRGVTAAAVASFSAMAFRRARRKNSRAWLYAAGGATALRVLQSVIGKREEVTQIRLRRGETIEIRERPRPS